MYRVIIIFFFIDLEAPTIACPKNQTIETNIGQPTGVTVWADPESADNSGENCTITCREGSGSQFEIGLNEVICKALDPYGNQVTCAFTVQVEGINVIDNDLDV